MITRTPGGSASRIRSTSWSHDDHALHRQESLQASPRHPDGGPDPDPARRPGGADSLATRRPVHAEPAGGAPGSPAAATGMPADRASAAPRPRLRVLHGRGEPGGDHTAGSPCDGRLASRGGTRRSGSWTSSWRDPVERGVTRTGSSRRAAGRFTRAPDSLIASIRVRLDSCAS